MKKNNSFKIVLLVIVFMVIVSGCSIMDQNKYAMSVVRDYYEGMDNQNYEKVLGTLVKGRPVYSYVSAIIKQIKYNNSEIDVKNLKLKIIETYTTDSKELTFKTVRASYTLDTTVRSQVYTTKKVMDFTLVSHKPDFWKILKFKKLK